MSKYAGNNTVRLTRPGRSQFDLSHFRRSSVQSGRLTPIYIEEAIPSDHFTGSSEILVRLAPLLAPIYDSLTLFVHFFFVPNRLIWVDWAKFITGGRLGVGIDPVTAPVPPWISIGDVLNDANADVNDLFKKGTLADHLGLPDFEEISAAANWNDNHRIAAMPFLAYGLIYMEYYRDRNFVRDDYMTFPVASGQQAVVEDNTMWRSMLLNNRLYAHDYFTAALPFTQRGQEVLMPLEGAASIEYFESSKIFTDIGDPPGASGNLTVAISSTDINLPGLEGPGRIENIESITLDATTSINDFRAAYALQVWFERSAIGGSRYTENTEAMFGVRPEDYRLQRPEYIGGGRMQIKISEIVSTAYSDDGEAVVPLANLAGHGITYGNTNRFSYFCKEHGFIIGIASIMAEGSYHQGVSRMWSRDSFLDYPWPQFCNLGEQQVDKSELYASPANMLRNADGARPLWGYQSRYAEWKQKLSSNHGDFHDSLLFWTATRHFSSSPTLGAAFLQFDATTVDRMFAVQDSGVDKFWLYVNNSIRATRPLPYFGTPNTLNFGPSYGS